MSVPPADRSAQPAEQPEDRSEQPAEQPEDRSEPPPRQPEDLAQQPDTGDGAQAATAPLLPAPTRFVFVDTEATGLDHQRHELTEVAWIVRYEDGREVQRQYFPEHTTDGADDKALELTHYDERIAPQDKTPAKVWLTQFLEDADGAVLVGAVPDFDARHLERVCRKLGLEPTWDHHLLDVETLALPFIAPGPETPRSLAKTCDALGVPHDRDQAHGALYDAKQAMRAFDAVWTMVAELRRTGGPLPTPIPRENGDNGNGGRNVGGNVEEARAAEGAEATREQLQAAEVGEDADPGATSSG